VSPEAEGDAWIGSGGSLGRWGCSESPRIPVLSTPTMGKGARIREQRRQERAGRDAEPDIRRLVEALEPIASPAQFERLVNRRPALFGQTMLDYLQPLAHDPNIEPFVSRFKHLVERAHSDPADAWLAFRRRLRKAADQPLGLSENTASHSPTSSVFSLAPLAGGRVSPIPLSRAKR
jgi:hypothetical protein